jgi:hypothetical protein
VNAVDSFVSSWFFNLPAFGVQLTKHLFREETTKQTGEHPTRRNAPGQFGSQDRELESPHRFPRSGELAVAR